MGGDSCLLCMWMCEPSPPTNFIATQILVKYIWIPIIVKEKHSVATCLSLKFSEKASQIFAGLGKKWKGNLEHNRSMFLFSKLILTQIWVKNHKQLNSTRSSHTKVSCWWLMFSVLGGTDHTMVRLKPVASVHYRSREIQESKDIITHDVTLICLCVWCMFRICIRLENRSTKTLGPC